MRYVKHNEAELLREISCNFYDRGPALGIGSASDREVLCLLRPVCRDCPEPGTDHKRDFLSNRAHTLYLSAASSWEIAIKVALSKLRLPEPPEQYIPNRMAAMDVLGLPVEHAHALRVYALPAHHRDPSDRILIAQAQMESLTILTADPAFRPYDVEIFWAGRSKR
jgi:PIN domain nuclease of toxin-antitoxin system